MSHFHWERWLHPNGYMLSINSLSVTLGITFEMKGLFVNRLEVNCYDMQACALKDGLSLNRTIISYKTGVLLSKCERDRYNPPHPYHNSVLFWFSGQVLMTVLSSLSTVFDLTITLRKFSGNTFRNRYNARIQRVRREQNSQVCDKTG